MQSFELFGFAIEHYCAYFFFFLLDALHAHFFWAAAEHEISRVAEPQRREGKELENL
jgi:hypothetical protein